MESKGTNNNFNKTYKKPSLKLSRSGVYSHVENNFNYKMNETAERL